MYSNSKSSNYFIINYTSDLFVTDLSTANHYWEICILYARFWCRKSKQNRRDMINDKFDAN